MKSKQQRVPLDQVSVSSNDQVRAEIQTFLRAINSYPEHFAQHPGISFEEHRCSLIRTELKRMSATSGWPVG